MQRDMAALGGTPCEDEDPGQKAAFARPPQGHAGQLEPQMESSSLLACCWPSEGRFQIWQRGPLDRWRHNSITIRIKSFPPAPPPTISNNNGLNISGGTPTKRGKSYTETRPTQPCDLTHGYGMHVSAQSDIPDRSHGHATGPTVQPESCSGNGSKA
ncbi:hypothetical protein TESG_04845 [Trichophyton tonsurans CBS 112818]|uniref:Uncharacterized protein n=2 Tax=Trichophyton TaxID=5550 RepID=F2PVG8_TRIEC|nr:hypothetical protein TESG_04845 [Trichophyton tonsurans CBS 112818]EGE05886.1 hypothetical protein TEQG_04896 [Trichophyton equinum CBS 127.97]